MKRILTIRRVQEYAAKFPDARPSLETWLDRVRRFDWKSHVGLKASFADADLVIVKSGNPVYVFNIQRNEHRLIAAVHFNTSTVYVLDIMTHREYSKDRWKDQL